MQRLFGKELLVLLWAIEAPDVPPIVDELPLRGVVAAYAAGTTSVRGAAELRVKESDRIEVLAE